jgi:hypothetical protein
MSNNMVRDGRMPRPDTKRRDGILDHPLKAGVEDLI